MNLAKFYIGILFLISVTSGTDKFKIKNWKFRFLPNSSMGLFIAIALPLDLPNKNVYLSYNFEANYNLPGNQSYFEYPPLIQQRVDRQLVYLALETKLESNGYPGRACLLRTICEAALHSLEHTNGVLGDILHIIFTPSSTLNINLPSDYQEAEKMGKQNDCLKYETNCTVSFLDLISWIGKSV